MAGSLLGRSLGWLRGSVLGLEIAAAGGGHAEKKRRGLKQFHTSGSVGSERRRARWNIRLNRRSHRSDAGVDPLPRQRPISYDALDCVAKPLFGNEI